MLGERSRALEDQIAEAIPDLAGPLQGSGLTFEQAAAETLRLLRETSRPEIKKLAALTDSHAEAPFRINNPLANFAPFHDHFGTKKGDKLYRDPKQRAEIW